MSEERNIDHFSLMILVLSIIAIVSNTLGLRFARYYHSDYDGYGYACLQLPSCSDSTGLVYVLLILILVLFMIQIIIALNELLPNKFIPIDVNKYAIYLAILTWIFAIIGLVSFGITYSSHEWWPEIGFYGILVCGFFNTILFFLKERKK